MKSHLQKSSFYQNEGKAQKQTLQYLLQTSPSKPTQNQILSSYQRYMKFRKWQAENYFLQISQHIIALANDQYTRHPKQLIGKVQVQPNWALFTWIVQYQNLMYWSKVDKDYASLSDQDNKPTPTSNLELPSKFIPQIHALKNDSNSSLKFGKCLLFMLNNLSTTEFYAFQFLIRLIKLNQFFKNMKAFGEMCNQFESKFDYFGTISGISSGYGAIFLQKNQPQLKKIKQEIYRILQAYEVEQMMAEDNSKFYDIDLCIRLIRSEIFNQKVKTQQKEQNFEFVAQNAGIEPILNKIENIRKKDDQSTIIRRETINVMEVIKRNAKLFDQATQLVENRPSSKLQSKEKESLKITVPVLEINSQNSNSIIQEETKKICSTDRIYEKLTFSKLYELSNHPNENDDEDPIYANQQKNILQMLEDEKTIRHNFKFNPTQVKKEKKIKKIKKTPKIIGFDCINGKISINEQENLANKSHQIKDNYIKQRLRQLQERRKKQKHFASSQESILEEAQESSVYLKIEKKQDSFDDIELESKEKAVKVNSEEGEANQKSTEESLFATPVKQKRVYAYVHHSQNLEEDQNENINYCNEQHLKVKIPALAVNPINQQFNTKNPETINKITTNKAQQNSSVQKGTSYKQSYKLANSRFAPISKSIVPPNRFNSKVNFIRRHKNEVRHSRMNLQSSSMQMAFYKKIHEPRYDTRFINFQDNDDEYVVDDTPPKYKKMKSTANE